MGETPGNLRSWMFPPQMMAMSGTMFSMATVMLQYSLELPQVLPQRTEDPSASSVCKAIDSTLGPLIIHALDIFLGYARPYLMDLFTPKKIEGD
jgi:hypothetical protein